MTKKKTTSKQAQQPDSGGMAENRGSSLLALSGMKPQDFGAALFQEAQSRIHKEKLEKSLVVVQGIISSLEECERKIVYFSDWKKIKEQQLKAIEAGEFSFDAEGSIVYDALYLNRGIRV